MTRSCCSSLPDRGRLLNNLPLTSGTTFVRWNLRRPRTADPFELLPASEDLARAPQRFLRLDEVCRLVDLCRASVYKLSPFPVSVKASRRAVRWRTDAWKGRSRRRFVKTPPETSTPLGSRDPDRSASALHRSIVRPEEAPGYAMESQESRSPLKGKPLRLPGRSVQEALDDLLFDNAYSAHCDRRFRANVTGHSARSALGGFLTPIGHVASTFPACLRDSRSSFTG
jgi:predicted DNA-binding transcriptional regulator AlpA